MKDAITYNISHEKWMKEMNHNTFGLFYNRMHDIEIGSLWQDTLGKKKYDETGSGKVISNGIYLQVIITDKTDSSIQYRDDGGFYSWIEAEDVFRVNNLSRQQMSDEAGRLYKDYNINGKQRFIRIE